VLVDFGVFGVLVGHLGGREVLVSNIFGGVGGGAETSGFDLKVQACVLAAKTPGAVLAGAEVMASSEWRTAG
jgi:hypothetical protein